MNEVLEKLKDLPYFTNWTIAQYFGDNQKANIYTSRRTKSWRIIRLKQWYYVTQEYISKIKYQWKFAEWQSYILTNIIYIPSYISLDTVLSMSQIIPEQSFGIWLISKNKWININNNLFTASYHNIKEDLFWWYKIVKDKKSDLPYMIAYPEKALIDWLWLKPIIWQKSRFEDLRLNLTNDVFDTKRFEEYIYKCNSPKMTRILSFIKQLDDYWTDW